MISRRQNSIVELWQKEEKRWGCTKPSVGKAKHYIKKQGPVSSHLVCRRVLKGSEGDRKFRVETQGHQGRTLPSVKKGAGKE